MSSEPMTPGTDQEKPGRREATRAPPTALKFSHCCGSTGKAPVTLASTENSFKGTFKIRPKVSVQHPVWLL